MASSDSDWDDDDDFASKKITIKIKPIAQLTPNKISASVDELRATVGTWKSLANINLVKPNSRRHHQSTVQLSSKLSVAFAIQECLNGINLDNNNGTSSNNYIISIVGHLKMAVPPQMVSMDPGTVERYLEFELVSSIPWNNVKLNDEFIKERNSFLSQDGNNYHVENNHQILRATQGPFPSSVSSSSSLSNSSISPQHNHHHPAHNSKSFVIDMEAVQAYVKQLYQKQPNNKYYLIPELLNYQIGSQNDNKNNKLDHHHSNNNIILSPTIQHLQPTLLTNNNNNHNNNTRLNSPIIILAHWLCDLTITKDDIINLKISLHVNGGVTSFQSKPAANWNAIDSKLTWSFQNLTELASKSTVNGITSCLARLDLNDGPSTPDDVNIEFSINGKTLTGTQVILNNETNNNFRIVKQKYEVKTGLFKFKCPCI